MEAKLPKVSVIIPCYNAEKSIGACLKGLAEQNYPLFEIVVVDDNSKDGTSGILKKISGIKLIENTKNKGPAFSRNRGVKESTGEIIILIDSDCLIEQKDLIYKHVIAHNDTSVHIVGGGIQGIGKGVVAMADNFSHWFLNIPYSDGKLGTHLVTNNMSIKRCVFEKLDGFNVELRTGEDTDFCERARKAGYIMALRTDAVVKHRDRENFKDFIKNFYLVGKDRVPARRTSKHRYWFILPFNFISSLIYCIPLAFLLSLQIVHSWFRYDKRVVLSFPIILAGRVAMTAGIVNYFFNKSFKKETAKA
jgi:glycosyltransferase involved in cell wall biosynthesis